MGRGSNPRSSQKKQIFTRHCLSSWLFLILTAGRGRGGDLIPGAEERHSTQQAWHTIHNTRQGQCPGDVYSPCDVTHEQGGDQEAEVVTGEQDPEHWAAEVEVFL